MRRFYKNIKIVAMVGNGTIFGSPGLPGEMALVIANQNPWWQGKPASEKGLYPFRRWPYSIIRRRLEDRLAPIVLVRGPRQVGKTVLQYQTIEALLNEGVAPERVLRVQFDELPSFAGTGIQEPVLRIITWYEENILRATLNETARRNEYAYLFFDEVQNLRSWAPQLKSLVDNSSVSVVATGSSALRIAAGRDSLAGRIAGVDVGPLFLREIAALRGFGEITPFVEDNNWVEATKPEFWERLKLFGETHADIRDKAFEAFSERGSYPLTQTKTGTPWADIAEQLNNNIIKRVIEHDLRTSERGRKRDPELLEELFTLAVRYAGQAPEPRLLAREIGRALNADVGGQRVVNYLNFLDSSLIVRLVKPLEIRLKKKKGPNKITLCDHALRASWLGEITPLTPAGLERSPSATILAGHLAENVTGYFLSSIPALRVAWFPRRCDQPEVDYVVTIGDKLIPIEVKYQRRLDPYADTEGLRAFVENRANNAVFALLVTQTDETVIRDPRIISVPLSTFLLLR